MDSRQACQSADTGPRVPARAASVLLQRFAGTPAAARAAAAPPAHAAAPLTSQWRAMSAPVWPRACSSAYGTRRAASVRALLRSQHMLQNTQLALKRRASGSYASATQWLLMMWKSAQRAEQPQLAGWSQPASKRGMQ